MSHNTWIHPLTSSANESAEKLSRDAQLYYDRSIGMGESFGYPSEYFYRRTLETGKGDFLSTQHLEYIYATLVSWGMNRMGETNTKLVSFEAFAQSILALGDRLKQLRELRLEQLSDGEFNHIFSSLEGMYRNLRVSRASSLLVANSKTMHNVLPHLIPPIDRHYTVRFFSQSAQSFKKIARKGKLKWRHLRHPKLDEEWPFFKAVCSTYRSILRSEAFQNTEIGSMTSVASRPKLIDDLIVAFVRTHAGESAR